MKRGPNSPWLTPFEVALFENPSASAARKRKPDALAEEVPRASGPSATVREHRQWTCCGENDQPLLDGRRQGKSLYPRRVDLRCYRTVASRTSTRGTSSAHASGFLFVAALGEANNFKKRIKTNARGYEGQAPRA